MVSPSAKLKLYGLLMQAKRGDMQHGGNADKVKHPDVLSKLKDDSWEAEKGVSRRDAMRKYSELLTEIAPQWRMAVSSGQSEIYIPNRKMNETDETLLALARRCPPPPARWTALPQKGCAAGGRLQAAPHDDCL